ncbi:MULTISPECIES: helix-turn-helix transcriptional regulator [unclassified Phyllobacterium]|uniref:helix-turn-helix domain-containing protein n=1 Tax=Phyllobacterium TaxID=28100 RepID=UPI000DD8D437|nr:MULTISPECIES: helix-turn-helix transcriptional regulator [unclassified Phyllobacterium]MBA8900906.1 transcriptional regulator with XRE-family HTH domain [Phyllobacterium sp. P30BS-XVII]UGX86815.1 helix-turn-helix domain-containing protein [Phyllobacterium sp. T1293]
MDKRDLSRLFQDRIRSLLARSGDNQSSFASAVGIDRSALSQLLSGQSTRLPRVETLLNIAERYAVSLDWLLGLSQDEAITGELRASMEIEEGHDGFERTLLVRWHAEATGSKIRYVPARIPDLLRTQAVIAYETSLVHRDPTAQITETAFRLDYNRQPGTDMEVCMPYQTLRDFAGGGGIWGDLSRKVRIEQLEHMTTLLDELYPSFRLFLFDGRERFSVPYTVFGPYRAAIFVGEMYLVLNTTDAVQTLQRHFDGLIRVAKINAHEVGAYISSLKVD